MQLHQQHYLVVLVLLACLAVVQVRTGQAECGGQGPPQHAVDHCHRPGRVHRGRGEGERVTANRRRRNRAALVVIVAAVVIG